ncbi:MAG TPA: hypothetical protein VK550_26510 [Polyangiaceae bacterium]|nr:hypothetical protein [Polyangiaceae bacterium]
MKIAEAFVTAALFAAGCAKGTSTVTTKPASPSSAQPSPGAILDAAGERYAKLVLALGERDGDYVDAFYGPSAWRDEAKTARKGLDQIRAEATLVLAEVEKARPTEELSRLRQSYQVHQLKALLARVAMLSGAKMSFDEESKALYDAVAPHHDDDYFASVVADLDKALPPGQGTLVDRYQAFRKDFVVAPDKLDAVFRKAIDLARARTLAHIQLPPEETFTVEYVTDKPWSGYNWYQGNYRSRIQVNTDLPIYIDRALDLAGHEGYPGHHVYNVLLEKNLVHDRGWVEFSVYPLYSPQSLIAEGSANYGVDVLFSKEERVIWEKENLFPLAGIPAARAEEYYRVLALLEKLAYADNEAARRYLEGSLTFEQTAAWLQKFALATAERALQRVRFIDKYRSYVINYNLGKDLVRAHVESLAPPGDLAKRWQVFGELLSSPRLPSGLRQRG